MRARLIGCVYAALAVSVAPLLGQQTANPGRIVGLLELRQVFGSGPCDRFKPEEVPLFSTPGGADPVAVLRVDRYWTFLSDLSCEGLIVRVHPHGSGKPAELPTEEFAYEAPAAIVYEQRDRWFRIRLQDGSAWVRITDPARFHPLADRLTRGLSSVTEAWDGRLAAIPGGDLVRVPGDPRRHLIGYLTPVVDQVQIPVKPGEDPEAIRQRHGGRAMGSVSGRDGIVRLLYFDQARPVEVRERPDRSAPVVEQFENDAAQEFRGRTGTSPRPLFVFDRVAGWFQIARYLDRDRAWTAEERVWIEDSGAWAFTPVTEAERQQLANDSWGREFDDVRVLGFRDIGSQVWVEVELMSHSICASTDEAPTVIQRGWMPLHGASGAPALWFASRGC